MKYKVDRYKKKLERENKLANDPFLVLSQQDQDFINDPENKMFRQGLLADMVKTKKIGSKQLLAKPHELGGINKDMFAEAIDIQRSAKTSVANQFGNRTPIEDIRAMIQKQRAPQLNLQPVNFNTIPMMQNFNSSNMQSSYQPSGLLSNLATTGMSQIAKGQVFNPTLGKTKA
tara:strand:- start:238 stop:756 length:519 start_codon:yes stop_codon:yes gene_type:complete